MSNFPEENEKLTAGPATEMAAPVTATRRNVNIWQSLSLCSRRCVPELLFGSQIQNLWCHPDYDPVFDILFTITLGVFILDITFRILVVPGYISFKVKTMMHQMSFKRRHHDLGDEDPDIVVANAKRVLNLAWARV